MRKKLFAILLVGIFVLSLYACGSNSKTDLSGTWKTKEEDGSWMEAEIKMMSSRSTGSLTKANPPRYSGLVPTMLQKIPVTNTPGNLSVTKTRRIKNRWLPQMILRSSLIKMENSLIR